MTDLKSRVIVTGWKAISRGFRAQRSSVMASLGMSPVGVCRSTRFSHRRVVAETSGQVVDEGEQTSAKQTSARRVKRALWANGNEQNL
jgi:hypothetical protein